MFLFTVKTQRNGTRVFSGPTLARFGGLVAPNEAFVLGGSATKVDKSCKAWLLLVL